MLIFVQSTLFSKLQDFILSKQKLIYASNAINNIIPPPAPTTTSYRRSLHSQNGIQLCDSDIHSVGVITSLYDAVQKYESGHVIDEWFESGTFPLSGVWKKLIKSKVDAAESEKGFNYYAGHLKFGLAGATLSQISSYQYWSLKYFLLP